MQTKTEQEPRSVTPHSGQSFTMFGGGCSRGIMMMAAGELFAMIQQQQQPKTPSCVLEMIVYIGARKRKDTRAFPN